MKDIELETSLPDGNRLIFRPFYIAEAEVIVDIYENNHYAKLDIKQGETVVDIGAHIGAFTLKAARTAGKNGRVIAFEPEPGNFELLKKNIELNNCSNVLLFNIALSSDEKQVNFHLSPGAIAHSIMFPRGFDRIKIRTGILDMVLEELDIMVDAIKIDAEGAALQVLQGSMRTLEESRPRVAVAAYHTPVEVFEVATFLESIGYTTEMDYVKASHYRAMMDMVPIVYGNFL